MMGRTLSHYKVLEKIGEGGMGEVYLAKDTKLDREIAVKVLPAAFSENKERLARFEREARLLASLNHPNIATIHELVESEGMHFLALEYVPGKTLSERIESGPIPVKESLALFTQIAEGLEAAHERGVIHRDLKPANIKVTPEGKVKILDFGLAKALSSESPSQGLSESPTLTRDITNAGVVLGTAPYMSPEQARGKPVDKRTDIWAFGCCLYEALTGKTAFLGDNVPDTLAKIVEHEPDWEVLPATTAVPVATLLRRCLQKDTTRRLHDIADARIEIEEAAIGPQAVDASGILPSRRRTIFTWVLPAFAALVVGIVVWTLRAPAPPPVTKTLVAVEPAEWLGVENPSPFLRNRLGRTEVAFSPDGRNLIYSAGDGEGSRFYVRAMGQTDAVPILGTENGTCPFFSTDGKWIGFWADDRIKKIPIEGGPSITLCEADELYGASWGPLDTIVYGQYRGGIREVSAAGGEPRTITELSEGEFSHRLPQILPDGETVLFTVLKGERRWEEAQIAVYSPKTGERKILVENGSDARYVPTGHMVFARLGALLAARFDRTRLEMSGGPVGVLGGVWQAVNSTDSDFDTGAAQFSFSSSGSLAYIPGGIFPDIQNSLVWVDRDGEAEPLPAPPFPYTGPRLSPDGRQVAAGNFGLNRDIWIHDISRGSLTRLTTVKSMERFPVWTPDGTRIAFSSDRAGYPGIYWLPSDGSASTEQLTAIGSPASWSPDGRVLAFVRRATDEQIDLDIWVLPLEGEPRPFIESPFLELYPTFSPDGRWVAYVSNQSGRNEVYVTSYPGSGPKYQVSTDGGISPCWAPNGRELFYRSLPDSEELRAMMAVNFTTVPTFSAGRPRQLFKGRHIRTAPVRNYDVTPDGRKFLMVRRGSRSDEAVTHIQIVLNWFEELEQLAPKN